MLTASNNVLNVRPEIPPMTNMMKVINLINIYMYILLCTN